MKKYLLLFALVLSSMFASAQIDRIVGEWYTVDDETGAIKDLEYYKNEIQKAENRLFSHGFLEGMTTVKEQLYNMRSENPTQDFVGIVVDYDSETLTATVEVRNHFKPYSTLEAFGPNLRSTQFEITTIINSDGGDSFHFVIGIELFDFDSCNLHMVTSFLTVNI